MSNKLEPCPFCGNDHTIKVGLYDPYDGYQDNNSKGRVKCKICGATIEAATLDEAIAKWNSRSSCEVVTVHHCFWKRHYPDTEWLEIECSRCGCHLPDYCDDYKYCPKCGAKMDAKDMVFYQTEGREGV